MHDTVVGVHVARLTNMTFEEQVHIHRTASVVVGVHGSSFVHCLWMPPNSNIIEIGLQDFMFFFKWWCNEILGINRRFYQAAGNKTGMFVNSSDFMSNEGDLLR